MRQLGELLKVPRITNRKTERRPTRAGRFVRGKLEANQPTVRSKELRVAQSPSRPQFVRQGAEELTNAEG